jgi:NAD(P)-dependent dehydrogenase (short-subunit alcohol dehydrogenase family)
MNLDLNDRIAVVTGASRGMGLAVVRRLPEEGARVVATSRHRSAPAEIAGAVAFLASPRSGSTTGAEVVVDSGMLKAS